MNRSVITPPDEPASPQGIKAGGWWHTSAQPDRLVCDLCPRGCTLGPGDRGFCFVRQNLGGQIVSTTYGRSTGFCIDPIEKKPLNHFYPGTAVLSFGTAGCNLGCKFCQNWSISKSREVDRCAEQAMPEDIAHTARELGCRSVAFTYNDPIVWAEYAIDTARACHALGIQTVAVTSGYINPAAREALFAVMDAANVDLKGFTEEFYWKLTSGHLEPVLDTIRWLVRHTHVWVELTNLVIPQANDSLDDIRRMCDWILAELGPDVPLHFTAFHPDFRLRDRGPTPPETLLAAHEVARRAGLHYVYTGNISDPEHQSTYCPGCGRLVIERDGYWLGQYALTGDRCRHCGTRIAGRFGDGPGDWGGRRQPVRIRRAPSADPVNAAHPLGRPPSLESKGGSTMREKTSNPGNPHPPANPTGNSGSQLQPADASPPRPQLTPADEERIFRAAGQRVAAAVCGQPAGPLDEALGPAAATDLFGCFVSLKRAGQLRSCCGYLGPTVPLAEALDHAALRAAREDPRFPPISPAELEHLDMEVWLLWGARTVPHRGEERVKAIEIGKHGLQISRGHNRGLLLPSVAVEHGLDAGGFLRQVCLKAGLPPHAWREDDTTLVTFEGYAIRGKLKSALGEMACRLPEVAPGGPTRKELTDLLAFCRRNVIDLALGYTPSFYLPGGFDGGVCGAVLTMHLPRVTEPLIYHKLLLRGELPLQATLFELCENAARRLQSARLDSAAMDRIACGLSVFWDSALHGTLADPDLSGLDAQHRAVLVSDGRTWGLAYDPSRTAKELLEIASERARLRGSPNAQVASLAVVSTEPRLVTSNAPRAQPGPTVRPPAVAGQFYPLEPHAIEEALAQMIPVQQTPEPWAGAMVPHAGWKYSGRLAAATLARVQIPSRAIVVCPKHTRGGADWAIAPHHVWALPGRNVESDPDLARMLADRVTDLALDAESHRREHAIEVLLPIIARLSPQTRVVGMVIHQASLDQLRRFADQMAAVLRELPELPLLVISTDMNHYAEDQWTRKVDRLALDAIQTLDPAKLYETVLGNNISMCGVLPAVLVMETLRRLDRLHRCELVGYSTSGDITGDRDHVVGYAGMVFG